LIGFYVCTRFQLSSCLSLCSYKLWYSYLCLRRKQTKGRCITDPLYEDANNTFERALVFMHKVSYMPIILLSHIIKYHVFNEYRRCQGFGWTIVSFWLFNRRLPLQERSLTVL
jgi:hypothetical protein